MDFSHFIGEFMFGGAPVEPYSPPVTKTSCCNNIVTAWRSIHRDCFMQMSKTQWNVRENILAGKYGGWSGEQDTNKLQLLLDGMKQTFTEEEIHDLFLDPLWIQAHGKYWHCRPNAKIAQFVLKNDPTVPRRKTSQDDIFFNHIVYGDEIPKLRPWELFKAWKTSEYQHLVNNPEFINSLVIEIVEDERLYWDNGDNKAIPKFLVWWNKKMGPKTGYYVFACDYFEDFEDNQYDFVFRKAPGTLFKDEDVLDFVGERKIKQLIPGFVGGIASFETGDYVLTVNDQIYSPNLSSS